MTAQFCSGYGFTRCTMAAACYSARIAPDLDTAIALAVSICIVCLRLLA